MQESTIALLNEETAYYDNDYRALLALSSGISLALEIMGNQLKSVFSRQDLTLSDCVKETINRTHDELNACIKTISAKRLELSEEMFNDLGGLKNADIGNNDIPF